MQDINKKIILFTVVMVILIGTVTFILINRYVRENNEPLVGIAEVNFTLNDIRNKFITTNYAKDNKCSGRVSENAIDITCDKKNYNFEFNGVELKITTDESGKEVFKYIVNGIEELHGYNDDEYLETAEKFINGEIAVTGLNFKQDGTNIAFSVNVLDKLSKYEVNENINNETIKNIPDVNYEYSALGYTISNLELVKNDERYFLVFSAVAGGKETYDATFTIKYYDDNNVLVTSQSLDLSTKDTYGNPYLGFVVTTRLDNPETYNRITKYSISLS